MKSKHSNAWLLRLSVFIAVVFIPLFLAHAKRDKGSEIQVVVHEEGDKGSKIEEVWACCLPSGECEMMTNQTCIGNWGVWEYGWTCDQNPCGTNPVELTTWGMIKLLFKNDISQVAMD